MPLTFEQAKLRVNPDPDWQPARNSEEHLEILALMRQSGEQFIDNLQTAKPPLTIRDVYRNGTYTNPITNPRPLPAKKFTSKAEFLSLPSNRKAFKETLLTKVLPVIAPRLKLTQEMLDELTTAGVPAGKKMSKKEFLTMEQNRQYMRLHGLLNNK